MRIVGQAPFDMRLIWRLMQRLMNNFVYESEISICLARY